MLRFSSLVLCVFLVLVSCKKDKQQCLNVHIKGQISNPNSDSIYIQQQQEVVRGFAVGQKGNFGGDFCIKNSGYYTLTDGFETADVFLGTDFDLMINLDTSEFQESLTFSGKGSADNQYLQEKQVLIANYNIPPKELYSNSEQDFLNQINETEKKALDFLNTKKGLSDQFKDLELKNIEFEKLIKLLSYPKGHQYFTENNDFEPSNQFKKIVQPINYDQEEYLSLPSYKNLIMSGFALQETADAKVGFIEQIKSTTIKTLILKNCLPLITPNKDGEKIYQLINQHVTDSAFLVKAKEIHTKNNKIVSGKPSPTFDYENHKGGKTTLSDLAGKYLYIDIWATWCGPCLQEIPKLKELEAAYQNKKITFVSISIDETKDHEVWKNMVNTKQLKGIQLFADNAWESSFVKEYGIDGIPRFILLDPQGNIVNADAPRPSDPQISALFSELDI